MATLEITLPDALAREAANAGLLTSDALERILRDRLRDDRIEKMQQARNALATDPLKPMTSAEIAAEIAAFRNHKLRASGP